MCVNVPWCIWVRGKFAGVSSLLLSGPQGTKLRLLGLVGSAFGSRHSCFSFSRQGLPYVVQGGLKTCYSWRPPHGHDTPAVVVKLLFPTLAMGLQVWITKLSFWRELPFLKSLRQIFWKCLSICAHLISSWWMSFYCWYENYEVIPPSFPPSLSRESPQEANSGFTFITDGKLYDLNN